MDTPDGVEFPAETLPEAWELQSIRKTFKGRTVEELPEAWELRNFSKSIKDGNLCENSHKEEVPHGDRFHLELIMLLAVRCLQRREIEDFSITYEIDEYPIIILKYTTEDNSEEEKSLRLLIRYAPKDWEHRRIFKSELIEIFHHQLPYSDKVTNLIVYTNMEWKQKSRVLEKLNFQQKKINEAHGELQRLRITDNCYSIGSLRHQIEDKCSEELKEFLDQNAYNKFVLATEQLDEEDMRAEVEKYFAKEYKLNSTQARELSTKMGDYFGNEYSLVSAQELSELLYENFFKVHPWLKANHPIKKGDVLTTFEDLIQKLSTPVTIKVVVGESESKEVKKECPEIRNEIDEG